MYANSVVVCLVMQQLGNFVSKLNVVTTHLHTIYKHNCTTIYKILLCTALYISVKMFPHLSLRHMSSFQTNVPKILNKECCFKIFNKNENIAFRNFHFVLKVHSMQPEMFIWEPENYALILWCHLFHFYLMGNSWIYSHDF